MLFLSVRMTGSCQVMSLKECLRHGISNNLTLINAQIDVTKGRTGVSQNRARLLPVISGVFQMTDYLKQPVNVTTGTLLGNEFPDDPTWQTIRSMQYNVNAGVQLNMPLYNQSIFAEIDVARTVEQLSRLSDDKAVEDLTIQISKVYYLAQSSLEQAILAGENISRMQELCSISEAMHDQGLVLEVDLNRVRINFQNLQTLHDQYQTLYARQINMLRFLMDLSLDTPLDVERMSDEITMFHSRGVSETLPELQSVKLQRSLVEQKMQAVKAGYIPTISLTGYAGGLGYQDKFSHFFHTEAASRNWFANCFIGLNITIPIFDANSKHLKIRQYSYEAQQTENRIKLMQDRLAQDYADAMLQLNHNAEVYNTQSQSYRQAMDVYRVTEEQYREGVASMTTILQDEMQLRTAQTACVLAHCQFNLARLDLLYLSGNLSSLTE